VKGHAPSRLTPTRLILRLTMVLGLMVVGTTAGAPQNIPPGSCPVEGPPPADTLSTSYRIDRLNEQCVHELRVALRDGNFTRALDIYYAHNRSTKLLNWVVYIDSMGKATQVLLTGNQQVATIVRAQRFVWISVFSEYRPLRFKTPGPIQSANDKPGPYYAPFRFARRTVEYRRDPGLASLVNALGHLGGAAVAAPGGTARADSTIIASPEPVGIAKDTLFVAGGRIALAEDAEASLSISADSGAFYPTSSHTLSSFHSVHRTIVNASLAIAEISIGIGATIADSTATFTDTTQTGFYRGLRPALFVSAAFNIFHRPAFPLDPTGAGVAVATNIAPGSLLDELVFGLNLSRPHGWPVGLTGGISLSKVAVQSSLHAAVQEVRHVRPAFIIELRL
jgi:hypothetical protein